MTIIEERYDWAYPLTTRARTELLVLHHEAASGHTAQDIHAYHLTLGWAGIAYHFFVRRDGSVYRGRPADAVGGHTRDHNYNSIGICFEGNFEEEQMGAAQLRAGRELITHILSLYPGLEIKRHGELNATACPGKNFPLAELTAQPAAGPMTQETFNSMADTWLRSLAEREPSSWSADARAWAEKNGVIRGTPSGMEYQRPLTREEYVEMEYRQHIGNEEEN